MRLPHVSVLLVNYNGRDHLAPCLDSIADLDYPSDLIETVLVDNASVDGSIELLLTEYPWVKVVPQTTNLGFAPAVTIAAQHAAGEVVALVNNDMRLDPGWVREAVARWDPASGAVCVAGTILDWTGESLDFGSAVVNFHGFGDQPEFGRSLDAALEQQLTERDGRRLPFACGGSMLVSRDVYLDLGGFDPAFFAYFEDVDFGLRLQVCGYSTVFSSKARSFHRHHGTSSRLQWHERMVLLERNALRILMKNVSDENLPRLLAGALLLSAQRAQFDARSARSEFDVATGHPEMHEVHRLGTARMHAVNDIVADLPAITELRRTIEARRIRTDREVFSTFGAPLVPMGNSAQQYAEAFMSVASFLRIDELFNEVPVRHVVVLCHDLIGERMAGTAIRSWELACAISQHARVTVACDRPIDRTFPGVASYLIDEHADLERLVDSADAVLLFGFDVARYPFLRTCRALRIVDLYDPWIFGSLEQYEGMSLATAQSSKDHEITTLNGLLDAGDFFVCASERQRDFWLGMLASRGRLDRVAHDQDPHLRSLLDVVAFGVPSFPPTTPSKPVLKGGPFPSIGADDLVVLWGGGTWDWFDPLGTIDAFARIVEEFPNARLFFMGLELDGRGVSKMANTQRVIDRASDLGFLDDGRIVLGPWVPYDERGWYLREADVGIVAAKAMAESRLAFRTRMLDHFWAGLPTLTTSGDVLSDLVQAEGAGITVGANDVAALAGGMRSLLGDAELRRRCGANAHRLSEQFHWSSVIAPIAKLIHHPEPWRAGRSLRRI